MNTNLLRHPMNWLVIWSMALVAFFLGHLLVCYFYGVHPGNAGTLNGNGSGVAGPGTSDTTNSATSS